VAKIVGNTTRPSDVLTTKGVLEQKSQCESMGDAEMTLSHSAFQVTVEAAGKAWLPIVGSFTDGTTRVVDRNVCHGRR